MSGQPRAGQRLDFIDSWPPLAESGFRRCEPALIVFLRGFWCDYCRQQFTELAEQASAFRLRGVQIAAITTDPEAGDSPIIDQSGAALPVLVDTGGELIRQLNLVDPFEFRLVPVSLPAVFLLDEAGVVRFHYVGKSPDDRPRIELLLLAAEHLSTGMS